MIEKLYRTLPEPLQPLARSLYQHSSSSGQDPSQAFKTTLFDDGSYETYRTEFDKYGIPERIADARETYEELTGRSGLAGLDTVALGAYYALIREHKPSIVVETGVAHGTSTLAILTAMEANGHGQLYSIDFPFNPDVGDNDLEEAHSSFLKDTLGLDIQFSFEDSQIYLPPDYEPGWVVPDALRTRWQYHEGRSQRKFPELVTQLDAIDVFIHDSDHSHPCQMFEYELAYEWIADDGILISDDISEPFEIFRNSRTVKNHGKIHDNVGYIVI
jgi:hypothetical protein